MRGPTSVTAQLAIAVGAGLCAAALAAATASWQIVPLAAWDVTALLWVAMVWRRIAGTDHDATKVLATHEDPRRATADALLLGASVASLIAVVLGIVKASSSSGDAKALLIGSGIATIVVSWAIVHTIFTLRYAALYYAGPRGCVDFNEDDDPCYADFAYLAFTIGMTYQVSDTDLTSKAIRHTALRHAMLSYLFGTVIIAATINLAAGLVK